MSNPNTELEKEFELERMILFSDAVFAIAITLLIIEIKFPEVPKGAGNMEILEHFRPTIIKFFGFVLSFFFIGLLWARHLDIFKYVRSYNKTVIILNLVFLFFVVCFPFTASGLTEHIRPSFLLPIYIYFINVVLVFISQYLLCNYLFKQKTSLTKAGFEVEKKYLLLRNKYFTISLSVTVGAILILSYIFPANSIYAIMGVYVLPVITAILRRRLKKYKPLPVKENNHL